MEGGHKVVRAARDAAIRDYAESLITPLGAVEVAVALKDPSPASVPCRGSSPCRVYKTP